VAEVVPVAERALVAGAARRDAGDEGPKFSELPDEFASCKVATRERPELSATIIMSM
jgi:hypothetical protein